MESNKKTILPILGIIALALIVILIGVIAYLLGQQSKITSTVAITDTTKTTTTTPVTTSEECPALEEKVCPTPEEVNVAKVVVVDFDGIQAGAPKTIDIDTNDTLIINSSFSCALFQADTNTIGNFEDVGYTLIGKKDPNGSGICANNIIDTPQTFYLNFSETGQHTVARYGCMNTMCLSVNKTDLSENLKYKLLVNVEAI
jgi:hypothetical protein